MYYTSYKSPIGLITIVSNGEKLIGLWIEGQKHFMKCLKESPVENNSLELFIKTKDWLDRYFAGNAPKIDKLPLEPIGTHFQQAVWRCLCEIPYGEVTTYGAIAKRIAAETGRKSMSAQAVGQAVGHNPISIIIPCHRVIGSDGSLTGYDGGLDKKIKLLELEGIINENSSII